MTPRFSLVLAVLATLVVLPVGSASAAEADPVWVFQGGGWGHGVGMSQFGAQGMALDGASADDIIDHYYSGAYIDQLSNRSLPAWWSAPYPLRVGLEQDVKSVAIKAVGGTLVLCQPSSNGSGCTPRNVPADSTWTVAGDGVTCTVSDGSNSFSAGSCAIDISWTDDGSTWAKIGATQYAHGSVLIRSDGNGELNVVLEIELEQYMRGIAEMPGSWEPAALGAQAIAARNYAVRRVLDTSTSLGEPTRACDCHLYDTVYDQVYAGWSKEGVSPGWVAAAQATSGQVAVHPSTNLVFTAYYSSSSGGATENNDSVWGGAPMQFLRSVDDPWSIGGSVSNPYASWEVTFTESKLASILGWDAVTGVDLVNGPPGATVRFAGIDGGDEVAKEYQGESLRLTFGLRSPYVDGVLGAAVGPAGAFSDVSGSVHRDAITYISDLGVTKGCNPPGNTRFCPDDLVTRGQMAAFLARAMGLSSAPSSGFGDTSDTVFASDIDKLVAAGITRGCNPPDNTSFCPGQSITRGQMAAFLVRAFGYADPGTAQFVDDDGSEFEADIARLATAGVTKGCNPPSNDRFCPDQAMTRAEMATFLMRALQKLAD